MVTLQKVTAAARVAFAIRDMMVLWKRASTGNITLHQLWTLVGTHMRYFTLQGII